MNGCIGRKDPNHGIGCNKMNGSWTRTREKGK